MHVNDGFLVRTVIRLVNQKYPTEPPRFAEVQEVAQRIADALEYTGNLSPIVDEVLTAIDTHMGIGISLVDSSTQHDEEWAQSREIGWIYSDAYKQFLEDEGWSPAVVNTLGDVSLKILGHLQDPLTEGSWDRRGLVIGHVQSGKTANYLGLIARAADAGYKFIIVIAGIHNALRRQTQERMESGFIGRSSDVKNKGLVGVGLDGDFPYPVTLTTVHDDFSKRTASSSGWQINDFAKPIVIVIKKHVSVLDSLYNWLAEMNAKGGQISDVPMLLIDDEADNASINTSKDELDPTKTNRHIRRILSLFAKSAYVGYTATPFANIFISPEVYDEEVHEELFPRDFIYSLDEPSTYFGPHKAFLLDETSDRLLRTISDAEEYLPLKHKNGHQVQALPPSLYSAVDQFVISRAIRNVRGQAGKHSSMMVNVSRFVAVQREVRELLSLYVTRLRDAVRANYALSYAQSQRNSYMAKLQAELLRSYPELEIAWTDLAPAIWQALEKMRVILVNSKSDEVLDFSQFGNDGTGQTVIAVGGLSLSRGLTIEGLTVSYVYRNTRMYDTLMQMGRWFGYRPGYEDLCRVHLPTDAIDWYAHISEASEELRQQIRSMRREGLSPKEFGLYVRAHPDSLLITASNKMRHGQTITVQQNLSGKLIESHILPADDDVNARNDARISTFWQQLEDQMVATTKGWIAQDISIETIANFLNGFETHPMFAHPKDAATAYLRQLVEKYPLGDVLFISITGRGDDAAAHSLGTQARKSAKRNGDSWRLSKQRVASRGDEQLGLTEAQLDEAVKLLAEGDKKQTMSDFMYRRVRRKPLLMLHVLGPVGEVGAAERIPAFGISFPPGDYSAEITVVANPVWLAMMVGGVEDTFDEDDDYDD